MGKIRSILNAIKRESKIKPKGDINPYAILLEAGQGKNVNGNMFALLKCVEKNSEWESYKPYFVVTEDTIEAAKKRMEFYQFKKVTLVIRDSSKYWELLNTCKFIITDNSYPPLYNKREGQIYLNTWHGTPLKYLGRSDIENATSIGNVQKNYFMCDYALFPNEHTKDVFMKDYMIERMYHGKNVLADYPRNGALLDEEASQCLRAQLELNNKKVVAYMPTWRGSNRTADSEGQIQIIKEKLSVLDRGLKDNEILYVNLHFLVSAALDFSNYKKIRPFPSEYETYEFLNVCDVLITDYSSVFFDFALTNKKIILFAYDKEEYLRDKGMYMEIDDFPFPIVQNEEDLLFEISSDEIENRQLFQETFCRYKDPDISNKILRLLIHENPTTLHVEEVQKSEKSNIVYHVGGLQNQNVQEILKKEIAKVDTKQVNLTLCFEDGLTPNKIAFLKELPRDVYFYSLVKSETIYFLERIKMFLFKNYGFFKNGVKPYLLREKNRLFTGWEIDELHFFLFKKAKYVYLYDLFSAKKIFHHLPEDYLGLKIFKKWYVRLLMYAKQHYDHVAYTDEIKVEEIGENNAYNSKISFQIKKIKTSLKDEHLSLYLKLNVSSYNDITFEKLKLSIGNRTYQPEFSVKQCADHPYKRWDVGMNVMIPFADSKGQELQNKVCFIDDKKQKYRILYSYLWKKQNLFNTLKLFIDETRELTYFFRYPKDTLTLTIRDRNISDRSIERKKVLLAFIISKLCFFFKPVVLFEKNAARYEESASVVYEQLMDQGHRNVYFILDDKYPFKDSIPEKYRSHIVKKYSLMHYICFFSAKTFIGSESKVHAFELRPVSKLVLRKLNRSKHNYIFLQHGVMYMVSLDASRRTFFKKSKNNRVRQRTVVSSQLELEHFTDLGGYKEEDLYLCGLPKFDRNVLNENPSKIFIMITWRPWEFIQSLDNIEETSYFKMLVHIVENVPEEYKQHVCVLPHPLVENQMRSTPNVLQPYIPEIIKYDDLLKDTKLLITDYSSISYDAFYRGSNVIFCWQEKEECIQEYGSNAKLMLTEELAFGDVSKDYASLNEMISYNYTHSQKESHLENYRKIVNFHDGKNTERLIRMLKEEKML